jgi:hypothetical protein
MEWEGEIGGRRRGRAGTAWKATRPQASALRAPPRHHHHHPRFPTYPLWPGGGPVANAPAALAPPAGDAEPPSDYVQWLQTCLNGYLGLKLPVSGVVDGATRGAIRSFQERRGLPVDGMVGPATEVALRTLCGGAGPPAEPAQEIEAYHPVRQRRRHPTGVAPSAPAAPFDAQAFRDRAVRLAAQELTRWGGGTIKETDPRMRATLKDYWSTGTGLHYQDSQLGDPAFQSAHPWSAAFMSWLMKNAGAAANFNYSAGHATYISAAKANRVAGNANPFKAYRIAEAAPQVGDLVCKSRAGSGATYDNVRPGMSTHCDIVTEVQPGRLVTVGGNVRNSVSRTTVRTDAAGRIAAPGYFAVIRAGEVQPVRPPTPGPTPGAAVPRLVRAEQTPPGLTLYVEIDLAITDKLGLRAPAVTGIFIPDGYVPGAAADLVLYLHGFKAAAIRREAIDAYWDARRFHYGALREGVNATARNVILVAPTLGSRSEAGRLLAAGGLDDYLGKVMAALRAYGPHGQSGTTPALGNLVLASHSGGGLPMRRIAGGSSRSGARIRECWGYDCTYNTGDDTFWASWAQARPNAAVYIYYITGSPTARLAEALRDRRVANAIVRPAKTREHNSVPITHWQERITGAAFLTPRPAPGPTPRPAPGPAPGPAPSPAEDVRHMTHQQFIEFVGDHARRAMTETGVPASVTVAQAILETGWGEHTVGEARNLFGIKGRGPAGSVRARTPEDIGGKRIFIEADFAKYDSFTQSVIEHARFFLRSRRWARAMQVKDDPDSFAREIHKAHYATASNYATELIKLMHQYDLYRFDRPAASSTRTALGSLITAGS